VNGPKAVQGVIPVTPSTQDISWLQESTIACSRKALIQMACFVAFSNEQIEKKRRVVNQAGYPAVLFTEMKTAFFTSG
jgi:hypothetical protein